MVQLLVVHHKLVMSDMVHLNVPLGIVSSNSSVFVVSQ